MGGLAFLWEPSERNTPMYMFLRSIGAVFHKGLNHQLGESLHLYHEPRLQLAPFPTAVAGGAAADSSTMMLEYKLGVGNREALAAPVPDDLKHLSKRKQKREMKKRWLQNKRKDTPGFSMRGWRRAKRKAAMDAQTKLEKSTSLLGKRERGNSKMNHEVASKLAATKIPKLQKTKLPRRHLEKVSQHLYCDSEYGVLPTEMGLLILGVEKAAAATISLKTSDLSIRAAEKSGAEAGDELGDVRETEGEKGVKDSEAGGLVVTGVGPESNSKVPRFSRSSVSDSMPHSPIYVSGGQSSSAIRCFNSSAYQRIADAMSHPDKACELLAKMLQESECLRRSQTTVRATIGMSARGELTDEKAKEDNEEEGGVGGERDTLGRIASGGESLSAGAELAQYQEQWRQRRKMRNQVKQMIREHNPSSYYKDVVL